MIERGPVALEAIGLIAVHDSQAGAVAALRGLDLSVRRGEIAAVVGPSGSGKTTFLRLVAGLDRPTAGHLAVDGRSIGRMSDAELRDHRRHTVGLVEQHYRHALSPYLPVRRVVELPLALRGIGGRARRLRVDSLLDAVGLADRANALPAELSGGEQQRVAVAAALSARPPLLLADEPTGELDAASGDALLALIREVVRSEGATAVIVTHDPAVESIADRVIVLQDGRAVAERVGPPVAATPGDGAPGHALRRLVDSAGWRAPVVTWRSDRQPRRAARATAPRGDGRPAAILEDVRRTYGGGRVAIRALRGVNATFGSRGVHAVTGPSGSGKSTLLRLIAGLDRPDGGRLTVLGHDLESLDGDGRAALRARSLAVVEQAGGLVPFLDARENVALAGAIRRAARGRANRPNTEALAGEAARVDRLLDRLGLAATAARRPAELSAGERTRVALARALGGEPAILLFDEPTATLDRPNATRMAGLLEELGRERCVIVATHDPALVAVAQTRLDLARPD